jgi:hypothetical protein
MSGSDYQKTMRLSCWRLILKYGGTMRKFPLRIILSCEIEFSPHEGGN